MTSYASVDRIEGGLVVIEVEMLPIEESNPEDFDTKATLFVDLELHRIPAAVGEVNEGDILVVEHIGDIITNVYYKDEEEKARRLDLLSKLLK